MESILIRERYKVTSVILTGEDYAALRAVDIQEREKPERLINIYEGEQLRKYLRCYEQLRHCPGYLGMFISNQSLVAVFEYHGVGYGIDRVFYKGAELGWQTRILYAEKLFHLAMSMSDFPPEVSCAAMLSENLRIVPEESGLEVNFVVQPIDGVSERELILLLTDQIKKVLMPRYSAPRRETDFIDELSEGTWKSAVALYSHWLEVKKDIIGQYENIYGKTMLGRALYLFFMNVTRWLRKKTRRKKRWID